MVLSAFLEEVLQSVICKMWIFDSWGNIRAKFIDLSNAQDKYSREAVLYGKSVITKLCPQHTHVWEREDVCSFVTHPASQRHT